MRGGMLTNQTGVKVCRVGTHSQACLLKGRADIVNSTIPAHLKRMLSYVRNHRDDPETLELVKNITKVAKHCDSELLDSHGYLKRLT